MSFIVKSRNNNFQKRSLSLSRNREESNDKVTYLNKSTGPTFKQTNESFKQNGKGLNKDFYQAKNDSQNSEVNQSLEVEEFKNDSFVSNS